MDNDLGGRRGKLQLVDVYVDPERGDYLFAGLQSVIATDAESGRLAAALFGAGVDLLDDAYVGTFVFRATPDAHGTFELIVRSGRHTMLRDSLNEPLQVVSEPNTVVVAEPEPRSRRASGQGDQ